MYRIFYDYYGECNVFDVPKDSDLEKRLDDVFPYPSYYEDGIEEPENFIEQGPYFRKEDLDIEIRTVVYDHLKMQNFYHGGKQSHMVVCKDNEQGFYVVSSFYTLREFNAIIESIKTGKKYNSCTDASSDLSQS